MTSLTPPQGFIPLTQADGFHGKPYNVIGVCLDHLKPARSKGTDYTTAIQLHDPSWNYGKGLRLRFFNSSIENLPKVEANGDVVILRNATTREAYGHVVVASNYATRWTVISGKSLLESTSPDGSDVKYVTLSRAGGRGPPPSSEELQYAKDIFALEDPSTFAPAANPTQLDVNVVAQDARRENLPPKQKWKLLQDLENPSNTGKNVFADLFGEVRKIWRNDRGSIELSLTDYTTNKLLFNYSAKPQARDGDEFGHLDNLNERWPGPWGRMTIQVVLFDAHAEYARSYIQLGSYVLVRNCHIKLDREGSRLEAACRGIQEDMSKVNVRIFEIRKARGDDRFEGLLQRRKEYKKLADSKGHRFSFEKPTQKGAEKTSADTVTGVDAGSNNEPTKKSKPSRNARKREKQRQKLAEANGGDQIKGASDAGQINQNVRCKNIEVPVKSISDILDPEILKRKTAKGHDFQLPFQNCSYKAKVRVVDYLPEDIADFAVPRQMVNHDAMSEDEDTNMSDRASIAAENDATATRWEWRFFLIVEDAGVSNSMINSTKEQMALLVADTDGDYLLDAEASNLRGHPQDVEKLKEKLFHLWGDLQERKEEARLHGKVFDKKLKSRPFQCFIKEYGMPLGYENGHETAVEYQRMFRMFGTSINT